MGASKLDMCFRLLARCLLCLGVRKITRRKIITCLSTFVGLLDIITDILSIRAVAVLDISSNNKTISFAALASILFIGVTFQSYQIIKHHTFKVKKPLTNGFDLILFCFIVIRDVFLSLIGLSNLPIVLTHWNELDNDIIYTKYLRQRWIQTLTESLPMCTLLLPIQFLNGDGSYFSSPAILISVFLSMISFASAVSRYWFWQFRNNLIITGHRYGIQFDQLSSSRVNLTNGGINNGKNRNVAMDLQLKSNSNSQGGSNTRNDNCGNSNGDTPRVVQEREESGVVIVKHFTQFYRNLVWYIMSDIYIKSFLQTYLYFVLFLFLITLTKINNIVYSNSNQFNTNLYDDFGIILIVHIIIVFCNVVYFGITSQTKLDRINQVTHLLLMKNNANVDHKQATVNVKNDTRLETHKSTDSVHSMSPVSTSQNVQFE